MDILRSECEKPKYASFALCLSHGWECLMYVVLRLRSNCTSNIGLRCKRTCSLQLVSSWSLPSWHPKSPTSPFSQDLNRSCEPFPQDFEHSPNWPHFDQAGQAYRNIVQSWLVVIKMQNVSLLQRVTIKHSVVTAKDTCLYCLG